MSDKVAFGLIILVPFVSIGLAIWFWVLASGGEHGERWTKRRMQGPFVPLSKEDIDDDARRSAVMRSGRSEDDRHGH